jgi:hypothetical protein
MPSGFYDDRPLSAAQHHAEAAERREDVESETYQHSAPLAA